MTQPCSHVKSYASCSDWYQKAFYRGHSVPLPAPYFMEEDTEVEKEQVTWPGPQGYTAHPVGPMELSFLTSACPLLSLYLLTLS